MPEQPPPMPSKKEAAGEREAVRKALNETEAPTPVEIERQKDQEGKAV